MNLTPLTSHIQFTADPNVVTICENNNGLDGLHVFKFDKVFRPEATQAEVYEFAGAGIVEDALNGFNSTVLAYGQTGSGKTHTIFGKQGLGEKRKRTEEKD